MRRFQLELIYLYFPPSFHQLLFDGNTVENKGKLILIKTIVSQNLLRLESIVYRAFGNKPELAVRLSIVIVIP